MSTFTEKTQLYVPTATSGEVDDFIYPAVYEVVANVLARNPSKFSSFASHITFTDEYKLPVGLSRVGIRNVFQKSRPCRWVDDTKYYDVQDSASIHSATIFDPVAITYNSFLYVFPTTSGADGSAEVIDYTDASLAGTTSSIDKFPNLLEDTVVLNIAMRCIGADMIGISDTVAAITVPTLSINTTFPQDASATDIKILAPVNLLPSGGDVMDITEDFSATITEISGFINTDWDESLAGAKVAELNGRIQNYLSQLDGKLKKWNAEFQEYTANNSRYTLALQRYQADVNIEVSEFSGNLQGASTSIQKALGPMNALTASYQMYKAMAMEQVEAFSAA